MTPCPFPLPGLLSSQVSPAAARSQGSHLRDKPGGTLQTYFGSGTAAGVSNSPSVAIQEGWADGGGWPAPRGESVPRMAFGFASPETRGCSRVLHSPTPEAPERPLSHPTPTFLGGGSDSPSTPYPETLLPGQDACRAEMVVRRLFLCLYRRVRNPFSS